MTVILFLFGLLVAFAGLVGLGNNKSLRDDISRIAVLIIGLATMAGAAILWHST